MAIEESVSEVLQAFLEQYYLGATERDLPSELIVNAVHEDFATLIDAISELRGVELTITHRVRATRARWQQLALTNAEQALGARLANRQHLSARFEALAEALNSMSRRCGWSVSTSVIPAVKRPSPPAWCSAPKAR